jgi:hypothetical protein
LLPQITIADDGVTLLTNPVDEIQTLATVVLTNASITVPAGQRVTLTPGVHGGFAVQSMVSFTVTAGTGSQVCVVHPVEAGRAAAWDSCTCVALRVCTRVRAREVGCAERACALVLPPIQGSLARLLCQAAQCCAVLCCAVLCCAVLCCAVLCCAVLCCAVLCCAVLY